MSGGMAWTVRTDFLEVWRDLVLHGMGEVDFHVCPTSTYEYNQLIFRKMTKNKICSGNLDNFPKSSSFDKMASFVCLFLHFVGPQLAGLSRPGSLGRALEAGLSRPEKHQKLQTNWEIQFFAKTVFPAKQIYFAPYGDSCRFDVTGWSGNILRIELDPVLPTFCLTE